MRWPSPTPPIWSPPIFPPGKPSAPSARRPAGGVFSAAGFPTRAVYGSPPWFQPDPNAAEGRALPLAAGLAVCDALRSIGLQQFRLRWPNDVLVGDRKLAGLLVDQFVPGLAVAGIGINVSNHPDSLDPALKNHFVRLADLLAAPPDLGRLTQMVLASLRRVVTEMHDHGFASLLPRLNPLWGRPAPGRIGFGWRPPPRNFCRRRPAGAVAAAR